MNKNLIAEGLAYLHLYLGTECLVATQDAKFTGQLAGIYWDTWFNQPQELTPQVRLTNADNRIVAYRIDQVKLILRPLRTMTDDEKHELFRYIWPNDHAATPLGQEYCINYALDIGDDGDQIDNWMEDAAATINSPILWSRITLWLTSKGFDLFELINTGFAIDSTKRVGGN